MLWTIRNILFVCFFLVAILQASGVLAQSSEVRGAASKAQLQSFSASSGLKFIPNRGQLSDQFGKPMPEVLYTLDGYGMKSYFTKSSMHYVFAKSMGNALACPKGGNKLKHVPPDTLSLYRVDVKFIGSNPNAEIVASDTTDDYTNYYLTNCPDGITHVPGFRKIIYRNIYPNIDLVLYTTSAPNPTNPNSPINPGSDNLEYDFVVHPGGDPSDIQISYDHATSLAVAEDGSFKLVSPFGQVVETKPNGYQLGNESQAGSTAPREDVLCGFRLNGNNLSFETGDYDRTRDLVIDPQRLWGTFFGGYDTSTITELSDLAVDRFGSVDVTGWTTSGTNIATSGAFQTTFGANNNSDGFIARFGPNGDMRWATYYGGTHSDFGIEIACDSTNGMVVTGYTFSTSGIASAGSYQPTIKGGGDAFVVSFDSTGARRWGTYIGGSVDFIDTPAVTEGTGVAIDSAQNIIAVGFTTADHGLATSGSYQDSIGSLATTAYLAKFSRSGALLWATLFGGSQGIDTHTQTSVDANNNIYMSGATTSTGGLATTGAFRTAAGTNYFSKWSPTGSLIWSTYYMDSSRSSIYRIAAARHGNLYLTGSTIDQAFATPGAYQTAIADSTDGFISKFDSGGHRIWTTYYGGSQYDYLTAITLDTSENVFAVGYTESTSGIATPGEYQTTLLGPWNGFLIKFDSAGHRQWGTYYGRRGSATTVGLDRQGHPFMGGYTGTGGNEYATPGAYDDLGNNNVTGYVTKFCDLPELSITSSESSPICPNSPLILTTKSGLSAYQWYVNGAQISGANSSSYSFQTPPVSGNYNYFVDVVGTDMCDAVSDTVTFKVLAPSQISFPQSNVVCPGSSIKLMATATGAGPLKYSWTPIATLDHPDSLQPLATPTKTTTYTLAVTDTNGCMTTKQVTVAINAAPKVSAGGNRSVCGGSSIAMTATASSGRAPYTYSWSPSTGLDRTDSSTVIATPSANTTYFVEVTDENGCTSTDSSFVIVNSPPKVSAGAPLSVCTGSSIKIGSSINGGKPPYTILWTPAAGLSNRAIAQPTASPAATTVYTILVTDKNGCSAEDSVLVTVSDSLVPTVTAAGPLTICTGDTVHLTAGSGYSTYSWSSGETTSDISVTKSGDYFVSVTNGGCSGTSSAVQVTVLPDSVPRPVLTAALTTICEGDSVEVSVIGSYSSYLWSTSETTPSIFVSKTDIVTVTATNSAGCSGTSAPLIIAVVPTPAVTLTPSGPATFCSGDSVTLAATSGFNLYKWSTGDSTASIVVKQSGTYIVTATNASGCSASSAPFSVTVNPAPNPVIKGPESICPNSTAAYDVSNVANDNYLWTLTPAGAGTIGNSSSASISVQWGAAANATLTLTETSPDGCSATTSLAVSITSNLTPVISANGNFEFCQGDSIMLDAGAGYSTYQWSKDGSQISGATNETIAVDQAGSYSVFVTASGGCSGTSAPSAVTVYPVLPKPLITRNGSKLTSSGSAQYQWAYGGSIISGGNSQTITPDTDGLYTVTITDSNGCTSTSDPYLFANVDSVLVSTIGGVAAPGDTVSIALKLDLANGLAASGAKTYVANIGLDRTMLSPISPAGVLVGNNWIVSLTGSVPNAPGVLQTITALALDSGYCSNVQIDTFYFPGATIDVTTESGVFCISGTCRPVVESSDTAFTIKQVFPNPSDGSFTIEYHLASDGPLSIYLEDYLGRNVQQLKNEWSLAGDENETYSAQAIPSGIYRIVLRSGERVLNAMIVVAR